MTRGSKFADPFGSGGAGCGDTIHIYFCFSIIMLLVLYCHFHGLLDFMKLLRLLAMQGHDE